MFRTGRALAAHAPWVAMPRRLAALGALALIALADGGLAGCGPITYVGDVTRRASDAVDEARAAHAETYAPYWWTRATQYLHKAREVAAHADFQGARRFGRLAAEAAAHATADARVAATDPSRRAPETDRPAPAKDRPAPAKEPDPARRPPPRVAPAKEPL